MAEIPSLAVIELDGLAADGCKPTWQEVHDVIELCQQIQSPELRILSARGVPVRVGGAQLWPLTIRALCWLDAAYAAFADARWRARAVAYAMAHSRMGRFAVWPVTGSGVRAVVKAWWRRLTATEAEVVEAMRQVEDQGSDTPAARRNRKAKAQELMSRFCAVTGLSPSVLDGLTVEAAGEILRAAVHAEDGNVGDNATLEAEHRLGVLLETIRSRCRGQQNQHHT